MEQPVAGALSPDEGQQQLHDLHVLHPEPAVRSWRFQEQLLHFLGVGAPHEMQQPLVIVITAAVTSSCSSIFFTRMKSGSSGRSSHHTTCHRKLVATDGLGVRLAG